MLVFAVQPPREWRRRSRGPRDDSAPRRPDVLLYRRELFAIEGQANLGDDVRCQRRRNRAIPLVRETDRTLGLLALDSGAVDLKLDVQMPHPTRRLRTSFSGNVDCHSLHRCLPLVHDVDDVDRGTRCNRVEKGLDRPRSLLCARIDPMLTSRWTGVEQTVAAPRNFGSRNDRRRRSLGFRR